jgi:uncharacterized damage-inducible protein DinB
MLKEHYIHMFKYNDWATREAANSIVDIKETDTRLVELLSHIIASQQLWLVRTLGREAHISPWEKFTLEDCIVKSTSTTSEWINLLESLKDADLDKRIKYLNTKGEEFVNTIRDIIIHIINHSTYHRAQIAQKVKASGGKPAITDYIVYQRSFQK